MNSILAKIPTGFEYKIKRAIESEWNVQEPIRKELAEYFLLYHSASYIRNVTWKAGTIRHGDTIYHAVFIPGVTFSNVKFADTCTQFALSFRLPKSKYLASCAHLVPIVLISKGGILNV